MFQSTPARGGRHHRRSASGVSRSDVSIHARTRRATAVCWGMGTGSQLVSIHARTRRATAAALARSPARAWFQSTPARGGRRRSAANSIALVNWFQSTPARGGRRWRRIGCGGNTGSFNPRPHAAGDGQGGVKARRCDVFVFQSTPARGGRPARGQRHRSSLVRRSIHARTRTLHRVHAPRYPDSGFQSTPARGGRHSRVARLGAHSGVSIHARTRRATRMYRCRREAYRSSFNPRPHAAGDDCSVVEGTAIESVSIHARTRRATTVRGFRQVATVRDSFNPRPHAAGDSRLPNIFVGAKLRHQFREPGRIPHGQDVADRTGSV